MADGQSLIFRNLFQESGPAEGELWIQAAEEHGDCRALALLVLDHGLGALRRNGAQIKQLVVHQDPTFDDLLAAHFVQKLLSGQTISEPHRYVARYAAMVREGLRPSDSIPVEDSLEGVFLFLRTDAEHQDSTGSLAEPAVANRFLTAWARMADRIDQAAAQPGFDPFTKSPLAGDPEFGRVRTYLEKDRCNFRDDVRRGQVFRARLPEIAECAALLLRQPKSLLFRYWFRDDPEAPGAEGYRLLMVDWGGGNWVFSTDPRKRISLQVLAERLQAIEPPSATGAPAKWFDGRPFHYTLIAAPRGGTQLSEKDLLKVVRGWAALRSAKLQSAAAPTGAASEGWRKYAAMFAVPVIGGVTNFTLMKWSGPPPAPAVSVAPPAISPSRGTGVQDESYRGGPAAPVEKLSTVTANGSTEHEFKIPDDMRLEPALALRVVLCGSPPEMPTLTANVDGIDYRLNWDRERVFGSEHWSTDLKLDPLPAEPVKITLKNSGPSPIRYTVQPDWHTDRRTLYVLSVGISDYRNRTPLPCAAKDARELEAALRRHYAGVFTEIKPRVRVNESATKEILLSDLRWLVTQARPGDLVVVTIAGHGELHDLDDREFFFLLPGSDPNKQLGTDDLSWREISRYLNSLKCSAVVVMDCCHSGGILRGAGDAALNDEVKRAIGKIERSPRGMLYLAACQADESAQENMKKWSHGALTLGLLEYLDGKPQADAAPTPGLPGDSQVLYLHDWCAYAVNRVKDLTGRGQSAAMRETENFKSHWVPLGVLQKN